MKSLEVLGGGGGEVTGSAYLLESNKGSKILIDCGMFQGPGSADSNLRLKSYNLTGVLAGFGTHDHADHINGFPILEDIFPLYMHHVGRQMATLTYKNAESLSNGLYPEGGTKAVLDRTIGVNYDFPISIDGLKVTFRNARHILASASLEIEDENGERIIFSGDIGNPNSRLFQPAAPMKPADIVVMESTYGNRIHPPKEDPMRMIKDQIKWIKKSKGTILDLAFAQHRTQILLSIYNELSERGELGIPVFLDAPLAAALTDVHNSHHELLSPELGKQKNPFGFKELRIIRTRDESEKISCRRGPQIIIAGSGMLNEHTRGADHALNLLPDKGNIISFCGYCVEGTPGKAVIDTKCGKQVYIGNESVYVDATVHQIQGLSAHADKPGLIDWLKPINNGPKGIRKVVLVHGDDSAREELSEEITEKLGIKNVSLPKQGEIVDFYSNS